MVGRKLIQFPLENLNRIGVFRRHEIPTLQKLFCIFIGLLLLFNIVVSFLQYFYMKNNILDFVDNTEALAGFSQSFGKAFVCYYNSEKFRNLMNLSEQFWDTKICSKLVKQEINRLNAIVVFVQKLFLLAALMCVPLFIVSTFFGKKLPAGSWNLENQEELHKFVYLANISVTTYIGFFISSFDSIFLGLCYEIITQFKILRSSLENLSLQDVKNQEDFEAYYQKLRNHLGYHNFLLKFIKELQSCYSVVFMIQYVTIAPIICTEFYFSLSERTNLALTIRYGCACLLFVAQFAFYCIPATFVVNEISTVSDGIYNSYWFSKYFRKLQTPMVMLIQASQNGLRFMACGLISININTLISVLKVAFSASAVLQSLNK